MSRKDNSHSQSMFKMLKLVDPRRFERLSQDPESRILPLDYGSSIYLGKSLTNRKLKVLVLSLFRENEFKDANKILVMKQVLITGTSRGLGLEFTNQYLREGTRVFACSRKPDRAQELQDLKKIYEDNLYLIELDVTSPDSRKSSFEEVSEITNSIDILINNAGIRFGGDEKYNDELGKLEKEDFSRIFQVNTIAPLMIVEKYLPLLKEAGESKIINISSNSGCIARRTSKSGGYSYAASKAALNMITKALSVDLLEHNIIVISLHPGWVKTTMELTVNAPLVPEESVGGMISIIKKLELKDTGKFLDWQGNEMPW